MARVFEVLDAANWVAREPNQIKGGDVIRVLDSGVPQNLAPSVPADAGVYQVAQVSASGVHVPARVPGSGVQEVVIGLAEGS